MSFFSIYRGEFLTVPRLRYSCLLLVLTLWMCLWGKPGGSQPVVIEGRVVLESGKRASVEMGGAGYQTVAGGSPSAASEGSKRDVLIWLESQSAEELEGTSSSKKVLDQVNKEFEPKLLGIREGDEVRIVNSDGIYHNVFSLSSTKRFDVGRRPPGEYVNVKFSNPGIIDVFCDIHSNMHAVIVVMSSSTIESKRLKGSGNFRFEGIPQGSYKLHFYAMGDRRHSVNIEADDMREITLETVRLGGSQ